MDHKDNILIIEDDDLFRKTLTNLLTKEKYEVVAVPDGKQAIEAAKSKVFDIIISDVRLTGNMDGIEVVNTIKQLNPDSKIMVIIMTGFAGEEAPVRAIKAGVDDYIYKPFNIESFLNSVRKISKILQYERMEKQYTSQLKTMRDKIADYNKELESKLDNETNKLTLLFETSKGLSSSLKQEEVLELIVERITEVLKLERCSILLYDEKNEELYLSASKGLNKDLVKKFKIKKGERISGWVLENKTPLLVQNIESDERFAKANEEKYYTGSFISVPLIFKGKAIGVINANNKISKETLNEHDFKFIKSLADQASVAIENSRLYSSLEEICLQVTESFTSIIDAKDHYTKNHSLRVAVYAKAISEEMGLSLEQVRDIALACELHDIGKIGVSENILNKPGKLTEEEMEEIRSHPIKGANVLKHLSFLDGLRVMIEQHHERYDGKGYPYGLKGEEIVLGARIIAVADSLDAMLSERPYSRSFSIPEAIEEIRRCRGTQFDPKIADIYIKKLEDPLTIDKWKNLIVDKLNK